MFYVIGSIMTLLIFIQMRKGKEMPIVYKLIMGISFIFSWAAVAIWFTTLVESWQLSLNTPAVAALPRGQDVINLLRHVAFLLPVKRLTLGVLYALPILLIPIVWMVVKWQNRLQIALFSTMINWLFFWIITIVDNLSHSLVQIPLEGGVLLIVYLMVFFVLVGQRPFPTPK
ncbi:MAG: hypothetical protein KAG66_00255 [Methylococcales bacterium]|nr:hypothetical protein [Methylococcales bacterium]